MTIENDNTPAGYEDGNLEQDDTVVDLNDEDTGSDENTEGQGGSEPQGSDENEQRSSEETASELGAVSDAVQRRIAKLTARMREAERREKAAVEYAQGVQSQHTTMQQQLMQADFNRLTESKSRIGTQLTALRQIIKRAREEGDVDTEMQAQERMTALSAESHQVESLLGQRQQQAQQPQQMQQQQVQQPQQAQQPQQPQQPKASPKAVEWARNNSWYGKDQVMTYVAWGVHQTLIEKEGIDPDSDEYYTELTRRVREELPHKFQQQPRQQRAAPAVASATRASARGTPTARRQVRLSPSQVAIAKQLNVPLEEYAKYVKE